MVDYKFLVLALIAVATAAAGTTYWLSQKKGGAAAPPGLDQAVMQQLQQQATQLNTLAERIDKMGRVAPGLPVQPSDEALRSLGARIDELADRLEAAQQEPAEKGQELLPAEAKVADLLAGLASGAEESLRSTTQSYEERRAEVNELFQFEAVDGDWAGGVEEGLNRAMTKPELEGVEVVSSECRSSMCRVEVIHPKGDPTENEIFDLEMGILMIDDLPEMMVDHVEEPDGRLRSVFYYGRRGQPLYRSGGESAK